MNAERLAAQMALHKIQPAEVLAAYDALMAAERGPRKRAPQAIQAGTLRQRVFAAIRRNPGIVSRDIARLAEDGEGRKTCSMLADMVRRGQVVRSMAFADSWRYFAGPEERRRWVWEYQQALPSVEDNAPVRIEAAA